MSTEYPPIETITDAEPWEPHVFKVGDRVRIRLSSECQLEVLPHAAGARHGLTGQKHPDFLNGRTGVVSVIDDIRAPEAVASGHRFLVDMDGGYTWGGHRWDAHCFAAIELELLKDST